MSGGGSVSFLIDDILKNEKATEGCSNASWKRFIFSEYWYSLEV